MFKFIFFSFHFFFSLGFHPAVASSVRLPSRSPAWGSGGALFVLGGLAPEWGPGAPWPRFLRLGFVSLGDPTSWCEANSCQSSGSRQASCAPCLPPPGRFGGLFLYFFRRQEEAMERRPSSNTILRSSHTLGIRGRQVHSLQVPQFHVPSQETTTEFAPSWLVCGLLCFYFV